MSVPLNEMVDCNGVGEVPVVNVIDMAGLVVEEGANRSTNIGDWPFKVQKLLIALHFSESESPTLRLKLVLL